MGQAGACQVSVLSHISSNKAINFTLEAEHVKKSAGSGYAKYGTKQESIEGALEELNDMIENYNSICSIQKEKQWG